MASEVIIGEVLAKRIYELVEKLAGEIDLDLDNIIIDREGETDSKRISLTTLAAIISTVQSIFSDDDFQLYNDTDNTKTVKFLLSALTASTERILSIQDKDYTLAGLDDLDNYEPLIHEPSTEPAIVSGTPNTLTFDLNSARQAIFEPRLSVGTHGINVDHTVSFSNASSGLLMSIFYRLTGTRIITFPSDVKCSVPSTIGTWDDVGKTLTLTAGTDDDILMVLQRNKTASYWDLSVNEISL